MHDILSRLTEELVEFFPEITSITVRPETQLGEIPEWDSMGAVNLQVFLNEHYKLNLAQDFLNDEVTFEEIIDLIKEKV